MKKTISILLMAAPFVAGLFFTSCQKSSPSSGSGTGSGGTGPGTGGSGNLLKTAVNVTYDLSSGSPVRADSVVISYSYDGQNRSTKNILSVYTLSSSNPQGLLNAVDTTTYDYESSTITVTGQTWSGSTHQGTATTTYYLKASGKLADSSRTTTLNYPGVGVTEINKYTYDANGYLVDMKTYNLGNGQEILTAETTYRISNGNTVLSNTLNPLLTDSISYVYSAQDASALTNSIGDYINTYGITGHVSVNLPQSYTLTFGTTATTITFAYTFDNLNRITSITDQIAGLGQLGVNKYYYY